MHSLRAAQLQKMSNPQYNPDQSGRPGKRKKDAKQQDGLRPMIEYAHFDA